MVMQEDSVDIILTQKSSVHLEYNYDNSLIYQILSESDENGDYAGISIGKEPIDYSHLIAEEGGEDTMSIRGYQFRLGYDLITVYYILSERQSCMSFYSGFAKKTVLDTFEYISSTYDRYRLLNYLLAHQVIIGFQSKTIKETYEWYDSLYTLDEFNQMVDVAIDILSQALRRYLHNLDDTSDRYPNSQFVLRQGREAI
jgi:hypothetical protein